LLETKVADKVRTAADRIWKRIKQTVEDIIEVGNDLLALKEALPHGQSLPWLKAEFGWSEWSAQNFMWQRSSNPQKLRICRSSPGRPTSSRFLRSQTKLGKEPSKGRRLAKT
jgi:hypothetical protein